MKTKTPKPRKGRGLILSRKVDESIDIDGPSRVTVIRIRGEAARLQIDAAPETGIRRTELEPLPPAA